MEIKYDHMWSQGDPDPDTYFMKSLSSRAHEFTEHTARSLHESRRQSLHILVSVDSSHPHLASSSPQQGSPSA